jgi:hypothetical protein
MRQTRVFDVKGEMSYFVSGLGVIRSVFFDWYEDHEMMCLGQCIISMKRRR